MDKIYGKELSRAIVSACGTKVIFNPQDQETAKIFSEYLGEKEVKYKHKNRGIKQKMIERSPPKSISSEDLEDRRKKAELIFPELKVINSYLVFSF